MSILSWFEIAPPPSWVRTSVLLLIALLSVRLVAGIKLRDIGFIPARDWQWAERLYLAQAVPISAIAFLMLFGRRLGLFEGGSQALAIFLGSVGTQLLWGFYQEVIYRGILQTSGGREARRSSRARLQGRAIDHGPPEATGHVALIVEADRGGNVGERDVLRPRT